MVLNRHWTEWVSPNFSLCIPNTQRGTRIQMECVSPVGELLCQMLISDGSFLLFQSDHNTLFGFFGNAVHRTTSNRVAHDTWF